MNKGNIVFGVIGLAVGLIVGFMFANSINKAAPGPGAAGPVAGAPAANNGSLPPNHPPLGTSAGDASTGAPLPQVTEAIEKAKQQPQDYEAQMTAADLYYQIERFDEAAKFYKAANKLRPAETEPLIKAGNAYFDAKQFEEAENWYRLALEKDPKNINVRSDLGLTFYFRTPPDLDRAITEYKASLAINPNHEISLQNLTIAYSEKGDKENLRTTVERLKKINPSNPALSKVSLN